MISEIIIPKDKSPYVKRLLDHYDDFKGREFQENNIIEMFDSIRLLDQNGISPILYFSWCIIGTPKTAYVNEFQLPTIATDMLYTMPEPLLNIIEQAVIEDIRIHYPPQPVQIVFNPFDVAWRNIEEYNIINNIIENYHLDDIRYNHFIVIQWYTGG